MNRHFHDARYYLRQAATHVTAGVREELAPVLERVPGYDGGEEQTTLVDEYRARLREYEQTATERVAATLDRARGATR